MLRQVSLEERPIVVLGAIYRTEVCTEKLHEPLAEAKPTENRYRGRGYDRGQEAEQKQVKIMEDRGDKNTIEDHIMDSGASFYATYCKEELEMFNLRFGKDVRWFGEAEEAFLHDVREDKETVKKQKCTFIGNDSDEIQYSFRDTKSHRVIRSKDITFVDSIYGARSATDSSSLTEPIQKSQVGLVGISENLAENDSIVAEHGLSSEITQSPVERADEVYSENGASPGKEDPRTPQYEDPTQSLGLQKEDITKIVDVQDSWNEEPCRDVHQVGNETEVEVLRSFNWPLNELITDDGVLPERVQRVPYVRRIPCIESLLALRLVGAACSICSAVQKVRAVALLKGSGSKFTDIT
ncbi:hypothetical protein Tco_0793389 [Tanacetum coccineum]